MSLSLTHAKRIADILARQRTPRAQPSRCQIKGCSRCALKADKDVRDPINHAIPKKLIDEFELLFYYHLNTGKEVIVNL